MGWTSQLVCLGLLAIGAGGVGARIAWVTDAPREGSRVARNVGTAAAGLQMIKLDIESEITYRYARTTIKSVLVNNNPVASQIAFRTTLPIAAFISSFHIDVGGHRHVGVVKRKAEARRIYDAARAAGKTAAEVELSVRDSNLFTVNVNVEARETVVFNLTYDELLVRRLGVYSHAVHIDPGQIVDELTVKVKIEESNTLLELQMIPLQSFDAKTQSDVDFDSEPVVTVTHPTPESAIVEWNPTPEQQRALKKDGVKGRFVVQYDIDRLTKPNQILVQNGYYVHFYAPGDLIPMNKHVVFVLDTSVSMEGIRIQQVKEAMGKILSDLRKEDFFSIVEFNSNITAWTGYDGGSVDLKLNSDVEETLVVKASPDRIQKAKNFVQGLRARGSTVIYDALSVALKITSAGANKFSSMPRSPEPMIIFLSDGDPNGGAVTDKKQIPTAIKTINTILTSIFSLGFGKGIDKTFLKELSLQNVGFARLIYEGTDAALQLEDFYREVSSPLLKDLKFRHSNVEKLSKTRDLLNTLQSGTEMVMSGKISGNPKNVRASLYAKSRYGSYSTGFAPPEEVVVARPDFMERLWAYLNIQQLLEDPSNVANRLKAQEMALNYSFVTPFTSLVVVRPDVEDPLTKMDVFINLRLTNGDSLEENEVSPLPENILNGSHYFPPVGAVSFDPEIRSQLPETLDLEPLRLSWSSPEFNGTHVIITHGRKTKAYEVKTKTTKENFAACRGVSGTWNHCRHVNSCVLPVFVDNFKKYEKSYFCAIPGNYAGVCCPSS